MIRDTFFSLPRFVNVCRKEMVESWKINLRRVVLMYGVLAIALICEAYSQYGWYHEGVDLMRRRAIWSFGMMAFVWGLIILGSLSASFTMERMKTKNNRVAMLMMPATMFEKFLARWLVFTFGFLLIYLVAYKLADWTRVLFFMVKNPEETTVGPVPLLSLLVGEGRLSQVDWTLLGNGEQFVRAVGGYFLLQSCFVLGSSIWPRNTFVKTFVAGVAIVIGYTAVGALAVKLMWGGHPVNVKEPSEETLWLVLTLFCYTMTLFNWVLAYFRFKESEVIKRW